MDLAGAVRDRGHHVEVFGTYVDEPGPVADRVRDRGLPLTLERHPLVRTASARACRPGVARAMARAVAKGDVNVVHAYEYSMILDGLCGPSLRHGTRLIGTVYAMKVPTWLPRSAHVIAGTPDLVAGAQAVGQSSSLIVPPVDTAGDAPGVADGAAFRRGARRSPTTRSRWWSSRAWSPT